MQSSSISPDCEENILTYRQFYKIVFQSENYGKIEFKKYLTSLSTSNGTGNIGVSRDGINQYTKTYYKVVSMVYNSDYSIQNKAFFNKDYGILKIVNYINQHDVLERVLD